MDKRITRERDGRFSAWVTDPDTNKKQQIFVDADELDYLKDRLAKEEEPSSPQDQTPSESQPPQDDVLTRMRDKFKPKTEFDRGIAELLNKYRPK